MVRDAPPRNLLALIPRLLDLLLCKVLDPDEIVFDLADADQLIQLDLHRSGYPEFGSLLELGRTSGKAAAARNFRAAR